jgi:hypothetical protein
LPPALVADTFANKEKGAMGAGLFRWLFCCEEMPDLRFLLLLLPPLLLLLL